MPTMTEATSHTREIQPRCCHKLNINNLWGKLVGDRGYLSQPLFEQLFERGLQLIIATRGTKIVPTAIQNPTESV